MTRNITQNICPLATICAVPTKKLEKSEQFFLYKNHVKINKAKKSEKSDCHNRLQSVVSGNECYNLWNSPL